MNSNETPAVIRVRKRRKVEDDVGVHDQNAGPENNETSGVYVFENPANGHREEISALVWLWPLLFGWIYLLVKGLVIHVLVWLVLAFFGFLWLGVGGFFVVVALNIFYAAKAQAILRANYLRKGWVEVEYGRASDKPTNLSTEASREQASVVDELLKLANLRADGNITDEEYQRLKRRLIE